MGSRAAVSITSMGDARQIESRLFSEDVSFFRPYLPYFMKEMLAVGGEVYVSRDAEGIVSGAFIYDGCERTGTIFTRSSDVFRQFYDIRPFKFLFSEMKTGSERETYDIYGLNLDGRESGHRFTNEVSVATRDEAEEVDRFMSLTHQGINKMWVRAALEQGERCFLVRLGDAIAGLGWVSLVSGIGRLHSLYVRPQFRGMGIGQDIFFARLMWLSSKHAHSAFSEISHQNIASARIAATGGMGVVGQVFLYVGIDSFDSSSSAHRTEDRPSPSNR